MEFPKPERKMAIQHFDQCFWLIQPEHTRVIHFEDKTVCMRSICIDPMLYLNGHYVLKGKVQHWERSDYQIDK